MKNLHRIIIAVLICSLFLGYACLPVKVEASSALIAVTVGGASASVSAPVVLGILLLIASGYVISTLPKLIDDATAWINSVPGFMSYLQEQVKTGISDLTIVYIPEFVQNAMKKKAQENGKKEPDKTYIYLPPEFHQLDKLSQAQLLGEDVVAELQTGNWLAQGLNNISRNIFGAINEFRYDVMEIFEHIPTTLTAIRTQVVDGFGGLSTTLQTFRQNFVNDIIDVQNGVSQFRVAVNDRFSELQYALGVKIGDVNTHLHVMRETLTTRLGSIDGLFDIKLSDIKTAVSGFRTQFVEKIGPLQTTLSTFRTQFVDYIADIRTVIGDVRAELIKNVTKGINDIKVSINDLCASLSQGLTISISGTPSFGADDDDNTKPVIPWFGWFSKSTDVLAGYGVGLLAAGAVLNQFTDLSFFSSLITISLAIGLVAVFFGIIMNAVQSDKVNGARSVRGTGYRAKNGG